MENRTIIIGAGQAGAQGGQSLRQAGYEGEILMIGEEPFLPYQRPPLSKAYLKGELTQERLFLRPQQFYEQNKIELRLSERVEKIDRENKSVVTSKGDTLCYDRLLIATGAPPRRLPCPGADLENIYYLRSLSDSDALRSIISANGRIVIVGAGYIGLEVAAVARAAARDVTVLEIADRVLARVACEELSEFYQSLHRGHGVDLRLSTGLDGFVGENGALRSVKLSNGEEIECVAALVGIGAAPQVDLAEDAGLDVGNGIVVDDHARTSDPSIWAAGDCANFSSPRYGRRMRLESVPNAIEQAKVACANIAGKDVVYDAIPWFWSDQYDVKLQTIGLAEGADNRVVRGAAASNKFSVWHFSGDVLLSVDAINDPAAFAVAKKAMTIGVEISREAVADESADLKSLLS